MKKNPLMRVLGIVLSAAMLVSCLAVSAFAGVITDANNFVASQLNLANNGLDVASSGLDTVAGAIDVDTAVKTNALDTTTSAVKLGTAAVKHNTAHKDLDSSRVELVSNNADLANNGLKLASTVNGIVKDAVDPVSKIDTGLSLFNDGYDFYKNIEEIKTNHDNESAADESAPISSAAEVTVAENTNA